MMRMISLALVMTNALWAAVTANAATGVRVTTTGGGIAAEVLKSRVAERLRPSASGDALAVTFRIDPTLGGENARVTVKDGRAEIAAARERAFFYGVAKLLENIRFGEKTFAVDNLTVEFRPMKRIHCAYWARHFHNWYHMASAAELKRYAEDMMLMGMNCFKYQYLYPNVNRAGATKPEMAVFAANSKALYEHIRAMDADMLLGGGGNQVPSDSPEEYRGVPETDMMRGNLGFNACPAKPKALDYMLELRRDGIATLKNEGVVPKYFLHWPFDEGGCRCDRCRPWGGNGFIGLCDKYDKLNKAAFPEVRTVLATWLFHDDDYKGLWEYLAKPESQWIDALMIDSHADFPKYALEHPLPRKLPIITFPEISMYHRWPWGGYGAIAMPARFERLFRQCEKVVDGFMFYSEGLSEDINKFLVTRLYADPSANWQGVMKDYARLFLPGVKPDDFVRFCAMLEESHEFPVQDTQLGAEPPPDTVFAKCGPRTKEIAAFAEKLERDLLPSVRKNWRWRQLKLRAEIDAHAFNSRKHLTDGYAKMARELIEMYHVEPVEGYYEDYTNQRGVRPYLPNIRLEGRPGETVEYRVRRTNRTEHDIVVRPAAKCVPKSFVGEAGIVRADGTVDWNGSKTLKPGESVIMAGKIKIPPDAKAGHYGAHVIFPRGREYGEEYWWISLEVQSPVEIKVTSESVRLPVSGYLKCGTADRPVKLSFAGDAMCLKEQLKAVKDAKVGWDSVFAPVKRLFADSDYVVANLETPLASEEIGYTKADARFNTPDAYAAALKGIGVTCANTANNHCMDMKAKGLDRTIEALDRIGLDHFGTYLDKKTADAPYVREVRGLKIAFVGATYGTATEWGDIEVLPPEKTWKVDFLKRQETGNPYWPERKHPVYVPACVRPSEITNPANEPFRKRLEDKIAASKQVADFTVALPHVGGQFNPTPGDYAKYTVEWMAHSGADLVVGAHPHTTQRCERFENGVWAAYSLGNFAFTPYVGWYVHGQLAEYAAVLHAYLDPKTAKLLRLTFSVVKSVVDADGVARTYPITDVAARTTDPDAKQMLRLEVEAMVNRFRGTSSAVEISDEYELVAQ